MAKVDPMIDILLVHLDSVYRGKAWHGPTLRGSLSGVTAEEAGDTLTQSGHSIADIALHCAYWKYSVRRRLLQSKRGAFAWKGSNWFKLPQPMTESTWKGILKTLDEEHQVLIESVLTFSDSHLSRIPKGSKFSYGQLIQGIAAHDVFHAGQIRLLKAKRES